MSEPVQVLVVDDEDDIRNLVAINLRRAGFDVVTAPDGETGLQLLRTHRCPVMTLDLMLPGISGNEVCARLRGDPDIAGTYVVMLTARGEEDDRLAGFQVGADDYVTKPFSVKELVLRVRAAARRVGQRSAAPVAAEPTGGESEILRGPIRIDQFAHRAFVEGVELELTATEYRLLHYMADNPGKLCTRGELLEKVWELPPNLNTRTVDTHVKRLRQKLEGAADYIETVRGAGYRFKQSEG